MECSYCKGAGCDFCDPLVKDFETEAPPEEKQKMRELLQNPDNVIIPPEVEEQMAKLGLSKEQLIADMLAVANKGRV